MILNRDRDGRSCVREGLGAATSWGVVVGRRWTRDFFESARLAGELDAERHKIHACMYDEEQWNNDSPAKMSCKRVFVTWRYIDAR